MKWVAELDSLDQTQALVPLRTTSVSPSEPSRATRCFSSPAYQTRRVCEPVSNEVSEELPPPTCGSCGRPRSESCTTVPDSPSTLAPWRSTSSWPAVLAGSDGLAWAVNTPEATAATAAAATTGTPQRSRRRWVGAVMG